jgi:hypothetical protein
VATIPRDAAGLSDRRCRIRAVGVVVKDGVAALDFSPVGLLLW